MDKKFAQAKVQSEIRTLVVGVRGEDAIQCSTLAKPNIKEALSRKKRIENQMKTYQIRVKKQIYVLVHYFLEIKPFQAPFAHPLGLKSFQ